MPEQIEKINDNLIEVTGEVPKIIYTKEQIKSYIAQHKALLVIEEARLLAFDWEI